ncbi:hypothetical protein CONPUDRAFT_168256 [Coniophora puteana RWD-64-598 SS2]|uniref:Uncharacterized protein n=1 Tax=Coniophora puteana (strain RWD-64-598) TaxID=741705 RepID=A0A5M3MDJ5_CONPW|nr:uncharacterized protein CONPUDRAFT_168256 [Coniophora puteana RWD-64-598 SS2]EIW77298.1 hypothetical protein CONPUDRAFT_168256 [Coniophora puteana RWD-64-598 SS2]
MARMSILCSIIRMTTPKSLQRRVACATAVCFVVCWVVIFVQRMIRCAHASCSSDQLTGILQIVAALVCDVALVALPIWSFGASKLPRDRKMTLVAVCISTAVITAAIVFDSVEVILPRGRLGLLTMNLKPAFALTISNMFVITSWSWRLFGHAKKDRLRHRASPASASNNNNGVTFTTVDLNTCLSSGMVLSSATDAANLTDITTDSTAINSSSNV